MRHTAGRKEVTAARRLVIVVVVGRGDGVRRTSERDSQATGPVVGHHPDDDTVPPQSDLGPQAVGVTPESHTDSKAKAERRQIGIKPLLLPEDPLERAPRVLEKFCFLFRITPISDFINFKFIDQCTK